MTDEERRTINKFENNFIELVWQSLKDVTESAIKEYYVGYTAADLITEALQG